MARFGRLALYAALFVLPLVQGCAQSVREINKAPALSPVGAGLVAKPPVVAQNYPVNYTPPSSGYSLFSERTNSLYISQRALQEGDLLTVLILINDSARLTNASDRSRENGRNLGLDADYKFGVLGTDGESLAGTGSGGLTLGASGGSDFQGRGTTARSERVRLSVAAIVTQVLPNGNLVVRGTQEVRVNAELRILEVNGIVRPGDIGPNNTIPYDRIAEARISYGGERRITEVQQPAWGHQLLDIVSPL